MQEVLSPAFVRAALAFPRGSPGRDPVPASLPAGRCCPVALHRGCEGRLCGDETQQLARCSLPGDQARPSVEITPHLDSRPLPSWGWGVQSSSEKSYSLCFQHRIHHFVKFSESRSHAENPALDPVLGALCPTPACPCPPGGLSEGERGVV